MTDDSRKAGQLAKKFRNELGESPSEAAQRVNEYLGATGPNADGGDIREAEQGKDGPVLRTYLLVYTVQDR